MINVAKNAVKTAVKLDTYGAYIEDTDTQLVKWFSVPEEWLKDVLATEFDWTLEEFLDEYTWDHTEIILALATSAGVAEIVEV